MKKLIDLRRKARNLETAKEAVPSNTEKPYYPYQLSITLEDEELKKLGKSIGDFKVGEEVDVVSKATVTNLRQSDEEYGDSRRSVGLQLRKMKLGK
jgi:hypothetical protein